MIQRYGLRRAAVLSALLLFLVRFIVACAYYYGLCLLFEYMMRQVLGKKK